MVQFYCYFSVTQWETSCHTRLDKTSCNDKYRNDWKTEKVLSAPAPFVMMTFSTPVYATKVTFFSLALMNFTRWDAAHTLAKQYFEAPFQFIHPRQPLLSVFLYWTCKVTLCSYLYFLERIRSASRIGTAVWIRSFLEDPLGSLLGSVDYLQSHKALKTNYLIGLFEKPKWLIAMEEFSAIHVGLLQFPLSKTTCE